MKFRDKARYLNLLGKKYKPMLSQEGFDVSHILNFDLESFVTSTTGINDLESSHTLSHDLVDKCPANDMYSSLSILKIPLLK